MNLRHRPATREDEPFLQRLFASARASIFAALPLPEEQKLAFIAMQYRARQQHYRAQFPEPDETVLEKDGEPVGALILHRGSEVWRILDISVLEEVRNRGIGTHALNQVLLEAPRSVALSVEAHNPAKRLYERLGFRDVDSDGIFVEMIHPSTDPL